MTAMAAVVRYHSRLVPAPTLGRPVSGGCVRASGRTEPPSPRVVAPRPRDQSVVGPTWFPLGRETGRRPPSIEAVGDVLTAAREVCYSISCALHVRTEKTSRGVIGRAMCGQFVGGDRSGLRSLVTLVNCGFYTTVTRGHAGSLTTCTSVPSLTT